MRKFLVSILGCLLFVSMFLTVTPAKAQINFKDINANHWAYKDVQYLAEKEIINGYNNGNFGPNDKITRLQAVYMILREQGIKEISSVKDPGFFDITPDSKGYYEIAKAVELGFISGKVNENGEKYFDPNGQLTRAQMAKIMSLTYNLTGESEMAFSDVPKSHWAYSFIQGLAKNQITFGYGNGKFGAADALTRAQFSSMMARVLDESFREAAGVLGEYKKIYEGIYQTFNNAALKYNFLYGYDESKSEDFANDLKAYATDKMIRNNLLKSAEIYCFGGCDMQILAGINSILRVELKEKSPNRVVLEYLEYLDDIGNGGYKSRVTLVKEGGVWKLDNLEYSHIDFKLTKAEASEILNEGHYQGGYEFVKEINANGRKAYVFRNNSWQVGIYADNGQSLYDQSLLSQ